MKDIYVVKLESLTILTNDPLKLNNAINIFSINSNIIFYYSYSLNIYEYPEYNQHQYFQNQPVCFILPFEKSFRIFSKHNGYVFNSKYFALY